MKVGVDACIVSFQKKAVSGIYLVLLLLRREETDRQTDRQGTSFLGRCNCPLLSSAAPFLSASLPPSSFPLDMTCAILADIGPCSGFGAARRLDICFIYSPCLCLVLVAARYP